MRRVSTPDRGGQDMGSEQLQFMFSPEIHRKQQQHIFQPFDGSKVYSLERTKRRNVFGERDALERLQICNDYNKELDSSSIFEHIYRNGSKISDEKDKEDNDILHLSSRPRTRDEKMRKQRIQASALDQQIEERRLQISNHSGNNSNGHNKYSNVHNSSPVSLKKEHLMNSSYFYSTPKRDFRQVNRKTTMQERVNTNNSRSNSGKKAMVDSQLSPCAFLTVEERIARQAEIYHSLHNSANNGSCEIVNNNKKSNNIRLLSLRKYIDNENRSNLKMEKALKRNIQDKLSESIIKDSNKSQLRGQSYNGRGEDFDCHTVMQEKNQRELEVQLAEEGAKRIKEFQRKMDGQREKLQRKDNDTLKQEKQEEKEPINSRNSQVSLSQGQYQSQSFVGKEDLISLGQEDILLKDISKRRLHTDDEKLTPLRDQKMKQFSQELILFPLIAKSPKQSYFSSIEKRHSSPVIFDLESSAFKKLKEHKPSLISSILPFTPSRREPPAEINTNNNISKDLISSYVKQENINEKVVGQDILRYGLLRKQSVREEIGFNVGNSAKKLHEDQQNSGKKSKNGQREIKEK